MDPYSAPLFPNEHIRLDDNFLQKAGKGDCCFAEVTPLDSITDAESVTLLHWNRAYPSTLKFPRDLIAGMRLVHTEDFPGNSHEKITVERYAL